MGVVYLFDAEWDDLYVPVGAGRDPLRFPAGDGIAGWVAEKQGLYICKDCSKDPLFHPGIDINEEGALVAVPLVAAEGKFVGVLELSFAETPTDEGVEAAVFLGRHAGNAYIEAEAHAAERSLSLSLAKSFGTAVDALDPQTSDHSQRVARYAVSLAKAMKLHQDRVRMLEIAANLHDVGKTLLSSRSLDGKPQEAPKYLHIVLSEAFLRMVEFPPEMEDAPRVVKEHHEYYDGSGFPGGLKKEETLLESRILTVVNDFDAFRQGWLVPGKKASPQEALEYLKGQAGKLYDPHVMKTFEEAGIHKMDLRSHGRYEYRTPIEIENLTKPDEMRFAGTAEDISEGGILIDSEKGAGIGDLLRMFIYLPSGEPLEAIVRVARATQEKGRYRLGVHYIWHASEQV
jgi:hypothetical protein